MRRIIVLALAAAIVSASGARADKAANAFIDPATLLGNTNGFTNANSANLAAKTYSVGAAKTSGCKLKLQFKGLSGFVDGEKMICVAGADACIAVPPIPCSGGFGNSIVIHAPYSALSAKAGTKADLGAIGCGGTDATATDSSIACYKFDALYDPAALCTGSAGAWLANPDFDPLSTATDGLVGLCQWFTVDTRLARRRALGSWRATA
jgi:hypothetical protein